VRAALLDTRAGERVEIALETPPFNEPVLQAVGGNRVLVRDGEVVAEDQVRHPRTAAGFNDREIILVTVDGRQPGWSVGMTMTELAHLMQRLGCTEAVNLDGGGSTTAWAQQFILNRPSDGGERSIANALLVVR
jgi:exopolysaccharide biosynthesis protein